ncbi:MAG: DUF1549 and DUF1553 domain-containing protein, partial [Verrucomicrobiota bacterium]
SVDPDEVMPPSNSSKSLTAAQIEMLQKWVASGAQYEKHWAFEKPVRSSIPQSGDEWARNAIDRFVHAKLEDESLQPSPEADPYTLVRRVYLDLIGLPPTSAEADAFVKDDDPDAYSKLVQQLLDSPRYGERWARPWLDLARYADTNGYEKDRPRSIWPWRDWVINALNDDMPFDQFTIEQLAGDMLPNATLGQRIATGFHRNTMINEEGGIDPLEYRYHAVVDRVLTTGTTWMGLTTGCAQCHTHKYDPITHTDYFGLFALLNNADEPELYLPDEGVSKRRAEIEKKIATLVDEVTQLVEQPPSPIEWETPNPILMESNLPKLEVVDAGAIFSSGDFTKRDVFKLKYDYAAPIHAIRLEALPDPQLPAGGPGRAYYEGRKGDFFLSEFIVRVGGEPVEFKSGSVDFGKIAIGSGDAKAANVYDGEGSTGWSTATAENEPHELVLNLATPIESAGELEIEMIFERHFVAALGKFRISFAKLDSDREAFARPRGFHDHSLERPAIEAIPEAKTKLDEIAKLYASMPDFPTTMILQERPDDNVRPTFRHHRGEYLQPKEAVPPAVPAIFDPLPANEPANRLTFAKWLVSERNPLGARVVVNRAWHRFFGRGIVESVADFGTQSSPPSHPQLLDWLALEFVERGWSMKELHRLIVTSATYRQSPVATPELRTRDPENVFLARGPRFRLDAEVIRDVSLQSSGLLSEKMLGPSVYPPQDPRVTAAAYGNTKWPVSQGEDRHRRSLYTHTKRTAPFAAFTVFDGPTGETCTARRNRSNTPLQALTMLNDEMFVEMADALGKQAMELNGTADARISLIFRSCLTREPTASEHAKLAAFQKAQLERLGDELLSWKLTARAVLNLDELITKQ